MNPTFLISIAEVGNGTVFAVIKSLNESKKMSIQAPNMKLLMSRISKDIRKRHQLLQRFPTPEPPKIMQPGEARVLWTPNGD